MTENNGNTGTTKISSQSLLGLLDLEAYRTREKLQEELDIDLPTLKELIEELGNKVETKPGPGGGVRRRREQDNENIDLSEQGPSSPTTAMEVPHPFEEEKMNKLVKQVIGLLQDEEFGYLSTTRINRELVITPTEREDIEKKLTEEGYVIRPAGSRGIQLTEKGAMIVAVDRSGQTYQQPVEQSPPGITSASRGNRLVELPMYGIIQDQFKDWIERTYDLDEQGYIFEKTANKKKANKTGTMTSNGLGNNSTPDFLFAIPHNFPYLPSPILELITLEVKTKENWNRSSVSETDQQSAGWVDKRYLAIEGLSEVLKAPDSPRSYEAQEIKSECVRLGIGLISFEQPTNGVGQPLQLLLDAPRQVVDPYKRHHRITKLFSTENMEGLSRSMKPKVQVTLVYSDGDEH